MNNNIGKLLGMADLKYHNVLVLAPHTDDGELGAGGFIARLIEAGAIVHYAAFSIAEDAVPDGFPKDILATEVINATSCLNIKTENVFIYRYPVRRFHSYRQEILDNLISLKKLVEPDLVLLPAKSDMHQDHHTVCEEGVRAFKNTTVLGYDLIWNNIEFYAQCGVLLEERHILAKIAALSEYKSQSGRDYLSEDFIRSQARTRGVQFGTRYAETFQVIRLMM
jgi:LmbE family N-acetylglucosaminyl deacetylase